MVNYTRGNSGITFTASQVAQIIAARDALFDTMTGAPSMKGAGSDAYAMLIDFIKENGQYSGSDLSDQSVVLWIEGAKDVNAGIGFQAVFIREYTKIQYELRGGQGDAEALNQEASNLICLSLLNDIIDNQDLSTGEARAPDIVGLGALDAGAAASTVFAGLPVIGGEGDYAPWAGTLLFPYLHYQNFYLDFILSSDPVTGTITSGGGISSPVTFKHTNGTYDLVASLEAGLRATYAAVATYPGEAFLNYWGGVGAGLDQEHDDLMNLTDDFFRSYYGLTEEDGFAPSDDLIFDINGAARPTYAWHVGTHSDDILRSSDVPLNFYVLEQSSVINAGEGDDYLIGDEGLQVLFDGDRGDDFLLGSYNGAGDFLFGGDGVDTLIGGFWDLSIYNNPTSFDDTQIYIDDEDRDLLDGGIGDDIYYFFSREEVVYRNGELYDDENIYDFFDFVLSWSAGDRNSTIVRFQYEQFESSLFARCDIVRDEDGAGRLYLGHDNDINAGGAPREISNNTYQMHTSFGIDYYSYPDSPGGDVLYLYGGNLYVFSAYAQVEYGNGVPAHWFGGHARFVIENFTNGQFGIQLLGGPDTGSDGDDNVSPEGADGPGSGAFYSGGLGNDTIVGTAFSDRLRGDDGDDVLQGGEGDDDLSGGSGNDLIEGGAGSDQLYGGSGNDVLDGGAGNDIIDPGSGDDLIYGSAGSDVINIYSSERVVLNYTHIATSITVELVGSSGSVHKGNNDYDTLNIGESISSSAGFIHFQLGSANDVVVIGTPPDSEVWVRGGGGNDHITGQTTGVVADFADATHGIVYTSDNGSRVSGTVVGAGTGTDTLVSVTSISGSGFDDTFYGGDGDEIFIATAGNDIVDGGSGFDTIRFDHFNFGDIIVNLASGIASLTLDGVAFAYTLAGIESVRGSLLGSDTITGSDGADYLQGLGGNDILFGGVGDDHLDGGEGDDELVGGAGDDILLGGGGDDRLYGMDGDDTLDGGAGTNLAIYDGAVEDYTFTRNADGSITVSGASGTDLLINISGLWFNGTSSWRSANDLAPVVNVIEGTSGDDFLMGTEEADHILGGDGDDHLYGRGGDDIIDGGAGSNLAIYDGVAEDYTFTRNADGSITVSGASGTDLLISIDVFWFNGTSSWRSANDLAPVVNVIEGTSGDDFLMGTEEADHILGGDGDDHLYGRGGDDIIDGGAGTNLAIYDGVVEDYTFTRNADGSITVSGASGTDEVIHVSGFWFNGTSTLHSAEDLAPSIGMTVADWIGTSAGETHWMTPSEFVADGREGDDDIIGNEGTSTFLWRKGDGNDYFGDVGGSGDQVYLLDVLPSDVSLGVSSEYNTHIALTVGATGEVITLTDQLAFEASSRIEEIRFADGTIWNTSHISQAVLAAQQTSGDDVILGFEDHADTFVFSGAAFGNDTIANFEGGVGAGDVVELSASTFADHTALWAAMSDDGTDTTITLDGGNSIILAGLTVSALHHDDFAFV